MPFTTVFALSPTFIIEANHGNRDVIVNLYSLSNTGAVIRCWDFDNATNDGQLTYVALGKQQWGYVSHNNVRSDTPKVAVFPISFTKTIYTISTQLHMTNVRSDVGTGPYIVSYSNNQMSILFNIEHSGVIMDGAWWLVIGR